MSLRRKLPVLRTIFTAILEGGKQAYSQLGPSTFVSLFWSVLHIPVWFVPAQFVGWLIEAKPSEDLADIRIMVMVLVLVWAAMTLIAGPANAAIMYVVKQMREEGEGRIRDFFIGLKKYYWRALALYASYAGAFAILILDVLIGLRVSGMVFMIALFLAAYGLVVLFLLGNYLGPLLVLQDNGWRAIWRKALLLTLDNGLISLLFALIALCLYGLSALLPVLVILFYPIVISLAQAHLFDQLLAKYDEDESTAGQ